MRHIFTKVSPIIDSRLGVVKLGGVNDLVIVFVVKTSKEIKIHR